MAVHFGQPSFVIDSDWVVAANWARHFSLLGCGSPTASPDRSRGCSELEKIRNERLRPLLGCERSLGGQRAQIQSLPGKSVTPYPRYTTTVIGAYSVPRWYEPLDRLVTLG